jgi:hypothetical protein
MNGPDKLLAYTAQPAATTITGMIQRGSFMDTIADAARSMTRAVTPRQAWRLSYNIPSSDVIVLMR